MAKVFYVFIFFIILNNTVQSKETIVVFRRGPVQQRCLENKNYNKLNNIRLRIPITSSYTANIVRDSIPRHQNILLLPHSNRISEITVMRHEQASVNNVMRLVPMQKRVRPPPTFTTYSVRSTNRPRYDSLGQVSSKILPSTATYTRMSTNRPEYDRLGQVSSQTLSSTTTYSGISTNHPHYTSPGQILSKTLPNTIYSSLSTDPPQDRQVSNNSSQSSNKPGLGNIDKTTMPYYSPASTVEPVRSDDPNDKDYDEYKIDIRGDLIY